MNVSFWWLIPVLVSLVMVSTHYIKRGHEIIYSFVHCHFHRSSSKKKRRETSSEAESESETEQESEATSESESEDEITTEIAVTEPAEGANEIAVSQIDR